MITHTEDRRQLLVQHFMLGPGWAQGCPSCSYMADHADRMTIHLANRDTTFVAISRAPLAEIQRFRERMRRARVVGPAANAEQQLGFFRAPPMHSVDGLVHGSDVRAQAACR